MSAAPAANQADGKANGGTKKIIVIVAVVLAVVVLALIGALLLMKKNMANQADEAQDSPVQVAEVAAPPKVKSRASAGAPPIFVPLEPFIVNLADRETERFAQIGISLQVDNAKVGDDMKVYMPAIRNAVLLILSRKTADDLLSAEGKIVLAGEIGRGAARAMGYEISEPEPEIVEAVQEGDVQPPARKRLRKVKAEEYNPILNVHYANFIIQ